MAASCTVFLLGPFSVVANADSPTAQTIRNFSTDKERALLAYLACEADRPHRRDALAGLLWPDMSDQAARANLRLTLHRLRQTLGDTEGDETAALSVDRESVRLNSRFCQSDVARFDALRHAADVRSPCAPERCSACLPQLEQAVSIYRGDFLQGFSLDDSLPFSEWALLKREWLRHQALDCLFRLAACHQRRGNQESALYYARKQLELDSWREEAHRQVMNILAHREEFGAALSQYETCRQILARELGVPPDEETQALKARILAARSIRRHNLPVPLTPLIGRDAELSLVVERLTQPNCRLVTICGPGGIGKTRLALQSAEKRRGAYLHGIVFVSLAGVEPGFLSAALASTLADALAFSFSDQGCLEKQVVAYLQNKEMLLVLDSFEHLVGQEATLLSEIVRAAPDVILLVTSRQRLSLQAEWLIDLGGLRYPPAGGEDMPYEQFDAVQLFLQRARQVQADFTLCQATAEPVAAICRLVEGWPLAIELAAAAVRMHTCVEILAEIECGLSTIETPFRDIADRHRSVWAAFDHSWRLLTPVEARCFCRLSVFRGGFTEEAAESVVGAARRVLAALRDKSLLFRETDGRYALHELARQYAGQKLDAAGDTDAVRSAHLLYYRILAEQARQEMRGPKLALWLQRFHAETDNLRTALAWAATGGCAEDGLYLAAILWRFWSVSGYLAEGLTWLERLIPLAAAAPDDVRAQAQRGAGMLAHSLGDFARAVRWLDACLALYRRSGAQREIAAVLNDLGMLAVEQLDFERAEACYRSGLAIFRMLQDKHGAALVLYNDGMLAGYQNDASRMLACFEESLSLGRELEDERIVSYALCGLGLAASDRGELGLAKDCYRQSLVLKQKLGDRLSMIWPLAGMAHIFMAEGKPVCAVQMLGAVAALRETLGTPLSPPYQARYETMMAELRTQLDEASFTQAWEEGEKMPFDQQLFLMQ
ncbi:MAG: AfsR/SARP family transcriptional regulator [Chloroflexota bacterium]